MSKTKIPKYVCEMHGLHGLPVQYSIWRGKLPSPAKLQRHVMCYVVSTMSGYANEHIGNRYGISIPTYACIRENIPSGEAKVEWRAPAFLVLPDPKDYPEVQRVRP